MQSLQIQLDFALERYEPHRRSCCRFSDRFSIAVIGLLRLHIWLHVFWRHQSDHVALDGEGAAEKVCPTAGLHRNGASWQRGRERDYALSPNLSAQHNGTARIQPCEAAAVFTQIDTKYGNRKLCHRSSPPVQPLV